MYVCNLKPLGAVLTEVLFLFKPESRPSTLDRVAVLPIFNCCLLPAGIAPVPGPLGVWGPPGSRVVCVGVGPAFLFLCLVMCVGLHSV